jgi:hypothetical protein
MSGDRVARAVTVVRLATLVTAVSIAQVLAEVTVGPTEPQICFEWTTVLKKFGLQILSQNFRRNKSMCWSDQFLF